MYPEIIEVSGVEGVILLKGGAIHLCIVSRSKQVCSIGEEGKNSRKFSEVSINLEVIRLVCGQGSLVSVNPVVAGLIIDEIWVLD